MLKKLLILFFVSFLLCSCSKNNQEEITFSSWGSVTEVQILKQIISDFEKENPDIKINFMHIPQNYFQKIHLLFASSTAPDVIFINNLYLPVYAKHLEDLSGITDTADFYSKSIEAMTIDGKLYAIPRDISNFVFYYNKNITGTIPNNWTEEDFCRIIRSNTNKEHFGVSFEPDLMYAEPYLITLGFDEGMLFYKNLAGKYAPTPAQIGSSTGAQMFLDGKLGLYMSGRWMYPKIKENAAFPFGVVPFWGNVYADSSGWAISKNSKHKANAVKFIEFLSSESGSRYFASTGLIVPARKTSTKDFDEKAFLEAIEKSVVRKPDKNFNKTRDTINKKYFNL